MSIRLIQQSTICLRRFFAHALVAFLLMSVLLPANSYAISGVYNGERGTDYNTGSHKCELGSIDFNPFTANKDFNFVMQNPSCAAFAAGAGAVIVSTYLASISICKTPTNAFGVIHEQAVSAADAMIGPPLPFPEPTLLLKLATVSAKCATRVGEASYCSSACADISGASALICSQAPLANTDAAKCCAANAIFIAAVGAAVSALAVTWDQANIAYHQARICGHDWYYWTRDPEQQTQAEQELGEAPTSYWRKVDGYRGCLSKVFADGENPCNLSNGGTAIDQAGKRSMTNRLFREYMYGGKEYADSGSGSCVVPRTWSSERKMKILGYNDGDNTKQRYYMTGPGNAPVYACGRFLVNTANEDDRIASQDAYDCCKQRSQNAICIESKGGIGRILDPNFSYTFCEMGSRCTVGRINYEAYASRNKVNYVCAKTYSVCPYNHLLGGGTELEAHDPNDPTKLLNFCQVTNHCSKIPVLPSVRMTNFSGSFISSACHDMKGDSQNVYGYNSQLLPLNNRSFSAGLVQCYKETFENLFFNIAGRNECRNPDESPNSSGVCPSGNLYTKGQKLPGKSFFMKMQEKLRVVIQMVLVLSVTFMGVTVLLAAPNVGMDRKKLLMYVLKIGLVVFFSMSNGWQVVFLDKVLAIGQSIAEIVYTPARLNYEVNIDGVYYSCTEDSSGLNGRTCVKRNASTITTQVVDNGSKLDGCQFPRYNYAADPSNNDKYLSPKYPPGKEYLKIWDIFDCKLGYALGFGPEVSVPNLVMMILGGFLTGGLGIMFFVASFFLAFLLISIILRAMHIFLVSATALIIFLYVSPITIACCLFEKTKGIFSGWLKNMISFSLQIMILFAYLGIVILTFDKTMIGENVTFRGDGIDSPKTIVCAGEAKDSSIYCIFKIKQIKNYNGLEILGIAVPMLTNMNSAKLKTVMTCAFIFAVIMSIMDQIPAISSKLLGGQSLPGAKGAFAASASDMAGKVAGVASAIQKRGMGAMKKMATKGANYASEKASNAKKIMRNKGASKDSPMAAKGGDHAASKAAPDSAANSAVKGGSKSAPTSSTRGGAAADSSANRSGGSSSNTPTKRSGSAPSSST